MEVKKATATNKRKMMTLVVDTGALLTVISDRTFKESTSDDEAILKMEIFRDGLRVIADKLLFSKKMKNGLTANKA